MSKYDNDRLLYLLYCSLSGDLTSEEKNELDRILPHYADIEIEKTWLKDLIQILEQGSQKTFPPGFADRVLNRIRDLQHEEENVFGYIVFSFRRIALISITCIMFLAFNNVITAKELSLESLLALPEVSLENTFYLNAIFQGEQYAK